MAGSRSYRHDIRCPHCGSNWMRKDGHSRGKQTYRCGDCQHRHTPSGNRRYYSEEFKRHIGREIPLRFDPTDLRRAVVPDVAVADDVDPEPILAYPSTSYTIWEVGKPPDFVVEIASAETYEKDLERKPGIYESLGISEFWLFDHTGGAFYGQGLMGYRLVDGSYERMELFVNGDGLECGYSEVLGLNLCVADRGQRTALLSGQPNLRYQERYNPFQLMFQDPATGSVSSERGGTQGG